ncbi:MAG: hypothetical protein JW861_04400 [Bacteroidales bacterium]|nr:hypothetical protein [Bacteroidales bacterium]
MIQDRIIMQAVSRIHQRADRQEKIEKIVNTYVEIGILPQLSNKNNQILYGRRGTGKTHILRKLEDELHKSLGNLVTYIDGRYLGSSPQYTDTTLSLRVRCQSLFNDILTEIYYTILQYLIENPNENSDRAFEALENFNKASNVEIQKTKSISQKEQITSKDEITSALEISPSQLALKFGGESSEKSNRERIISYSIEDEQKILFPDINYFLRSVLDLANIDLYLIFDEWATIPLEIQPYLAEFFKRSFFPNQRITVKIASLEYRSNFTIPKEKHNYIGFELGSDIATNLDVDDYYVFDRNPKFISEIFSEILFRHIESELPLNYLEIDYKISTPKKFIQTIFSNSNVFNELVRASEGVIRDLIIVFSIAFFDSQRLGRNNIDKKTIIEAARQWFEKDKAKNLDDDLQNILRRIVDEVIGTRKARSFMIPRELETHDVIQKLFDARVLHLIKRGYADKVNPGVRYNVYSLDFGTYVDLIQTTKEPDIDLIDGEEINTEEFIVPFDDKRSIRRIILSEKIFNAP